MNNLLTALIIVLGINFMLWASQGAINEMNPGMQIYTGGGILENHNLSTGANPYEEMPSSGGAVNTESGNIFIDTFGSFMNWLAEKTGFDSFIQMLKAPYSFLKVLGVPADAAAILAGLWYIVTLALLILVATGRN
jgi:hypothetical protein